MRILHTSDWHLGRTLYGKKRYAEFERFFEWLLETVKEKKVEALLVAGDIFDTTTPSNRAQGLYYRFLCNVANTDCRHVVIVGGNHDSPTFLDAPKELLGHLNVHVVGAPTENPEDELLSLHARDGTLELLVCAVPYLRDRDLRTYAADESPDDKDRKLLEGITRHYSELGRLAERRRAEVGRQVPIIATGHLFAAGGHVRGNEGSRDLYVGSLLRVGADCFPPCVDYLALGHLHSAQAIGGDETRRYSGSPLAMNPSETENRKSVTLVDLLPETPLVETLEVPVFQKLKCVAGDLDGLSAHLAELASQESVWLEVIYEGDQTIPNLRERLEPLIAGSGVEILRIRNPKAFQAVLRSEDAREALDDIGPTEVFMRCMEARKVPQEERAGLLATYAEVLDLYHGRDVKAE